MEERTSCWSELIKELILEVSRWLTTRTDIMSFRGVCKSWRNHSVAPPPNMLHPRFPLLIPSYDRPVLKWPGHSRGTLSVAARSSYLFKNKSHSRSRLVMAEEVSAGKLQIRHPLTGGLLKHSATTLDVTRFQVSQISKGYILLRSGLSVLSKAVLLFDSDSLNYCTAFILFNSGTFGALRLTLEGSTPQNWHRLEGSRFDDIVSFKGGGAIAAVDCCGRLYKMGYDSSRRCPFIPKYILAEDSVCSRDQWRNRLVVDPLSGRLCLVLRKSLSCKLCIYELNEVHNQWDIVPTLGHSRVLFVGNDNCFFAPVQDFPECPGIGNSIIFSDNAFRFLRHSEYDTLTSSLLGGGNGEETIWVYDLTTEDDFCSSSHYPGLSQLMGSPLEWILGSTSESKDEEEQSDSNNQYNSSLFCEQKSDISVEAAVMHRPPIQVTCSPRKTKKIKTMHSNVFV